MKASGKFSALWRTVVDVMRGHPIEADIPVESSILAYQNSVERRAANIENAGRSLQNLKRAARDAEVVATGVLRRMEGHVSR